MTKGSHSLFDSSFDGPIEESRARLPEDVVDKVVRILSLDPNAPSTSNGHQETIKEQIWDRLVFLISRYGGPIPSQTGTAPKQLQNHALSLQKQLQDALCALDSMTYAQVFADDDHKKDFMVAYRLRLESCPKDSPNLFHSEAAAKYMQEKTGTWPELYPFDRELTQTIASLERLTSYFDPVLAELSGAVKGRGQQKDGKDKFDTLICGLCALYKDCTGEAPTTSPKESGDATGRIIPLLQAVLPVAGYGGEITAWALQKKVDRLKKAGKI